MKNRSNREGDFYATKVRLYLNEYGGNNLEDFCKAEKVSYQKMCNCLGRPSYRKSSNIQVEKISGSKPCDTPMSSELRPLVIDHSENAKQTKSTPDDLKNITVRFHHAELHMDSCSIHTMVTFLKEMEVDLC